ncbi:hypothetical protein N9764_06200 [Polaribacter sp.]|jgi:hypothetical protein|nr:hypothetical protein [Polaribacter sp.]
MMNNFTKIKYSQLNSKQKENYNFHKVASALADYGYDSMRLNNDWQGADFIAVKNDEMLKIQLKGRFTVDKKYIDKSILIAFIENDIVKIYDHDEAVDMLPDNIKQSDSWHIHNGYSWGKTPKIYSPIIREI